jgi:hypothetical protein
MKVILIFFFLFTKFLIGDEPGLKTNTYTEVGYDFPNPERGFHHYTLFRSLTASDVNNLRSQNITLVWGGVLLDDYINKEIDSTILNQLQNAFNLVRNYGLKVNLRFTYHNNTTYCSSYDDPPKWRVLSHIHQLSNILNNNWDVINVVEAGFIGCWGEWHSSSLANTIDRRDVLTNLLNVLPVQRMVCVRRPQYKYDIFGSYTLNSNNAFNGSDIARVGFHNDCFLADGTDMGTYNSAGTRDYEIDLAGSETRFLPFGGETCGQAEPSYSDCSNALDEMRRLHLSYLNRDYEPSVLNKWITQGCFNEIARRMGYRFVLKNMSYSSNVKPGGILHLILKITNTGFAAPFNPRNAEIILRGSSKTYKASLIEVDPRKWLPGKSIVIEKYYRIPYNAPEGNYSIILNLPDPALSLNANPYYSIRLANELWESSTGYNILKTNFKITNTAIGSWTTNTNFIEIDPYFTNLGSISSFKCSVTSNGIYISWKNPNLSSYSQTIIFKSTNGFVSNPTNYSGAEIIYQGKGTNYLDTNVTFKKWYFYTAYAKNIYNQYSSPATNRIYYEDTIKPSAPKNLKADLIDLQSVLLSWDYNKENDISKYNIYRKKQSDINFAKLNSVPNSKNTYIDNLIEDSIYYYYVTAVDTSSNESENSEIVKITTGKYRVLEDDVCKVAPNVIDLSEEKVIKIYFKLNSSSEVDIRLYNIYGKLIKEEKLSYGSGIYSVEIPIDNLNLASGIYFLKVKSFEFIKSFKLVIK